MFFFSHALSPPLYHLALSPKSTITYRLNVQLGSLPSKMVGKRKASPEASPQHGQRRIKRREMASVEGASRGGSPRASTLPLSQPLTASTPSTSSISPMVTIPEQPNKSLDQLPCPRELLRGPRTAAKATQIFDHLITY